MDDKQSQEDFIESCRQGDVVVFLQRLQALATQAQQLSAEQSQAVLHSLHCGLRFVVLKGQTQLLRAFLQYTKCAESRLESLGDEEVSGEVKRRFRRHALFDRSGGVGLLTWAVLAGHEAIVGEVLPLYQNEVELGVGFVDQDGESLLFKAARTGRLAILRTLISTLDVDKVKMLLECQSKGGKSVLEVAKTAAIKELLTQTYRKLTKKRSAPSTDQLLSFPRVEVDKSFQQQHANKERCLVCPAKYFHGIDQPVIDVFVKMRVGKGEAMLREEFAITERLHQSNGDLFVRPIAFLTTTNSMAIVWIGAEDNSGDDDQDNLNNYQYCAIVLEKGFSSLETFLQQHTRLRSREKKHLIHRILQMVHSAHESNVVLMDLKPENIICFESEEVSSQSCWKSIDFDNSRLVGEAVRVNLTPSYASFEMARFVLNSTSSDAPNLHSDKAMDVASFGWLMLKIWTGQTFWQHRNSEERVLHQLVHFSEDSDILKQALDGIFSTDGDREDRVMVCNLVERCLNIDPASRPTSIQLLECVQQWMQINT